MRTFPVARRTGRTRLLYMPGKCYVCISKWFLFTVNYNTNTNSLNSSPKCYIYSQFTPPAKSNADNYRARARIDWRTRCIICIGNGLVDHTQSIALHHTQPEERNIQLELGLTSAIWLGNRNGSRAQRPRELRTELNAFAYNVCHYVTALCIFKWWVPHTCPQVQAMKIVHSWSSDKDQRAQINF